MKLKLQMEKILKKEKKINRFIYPFHNKKI